MFLESDKAHCVILFKYYYKNSREASSKSQKKLNFSGMFLDRNICCYLIGLFLVGVEPSL